MLREPSLVKNQHQAWTFPRFAFVGGIVSFLPCEQPPSVVMAHRRRSMLRDFVELIGLWFEYRRSDTEVSAIRQLGMEFMSIETFSCISSATSDGPASLCGYAFS